MTKDRLDRLLEWMDDAAGAEVPFVHSDSVQKLAVERAALIGALRWISAATEDGRTQAQIAKEAIAKAEAP